MNVDGNTYTAFKFEGVEYYVHEAVDLEDGATYFIISEVNTGLRITEETTPVLHDRIVKAVRDYYHLMNWDENEI